MQPVPQGSAVTLKHCIPIKECNHPCNDSTRINATKQESEDSHLQPIPQGRPVLWTTSDSNVQVVPQGRTVTLMRRRRVTKAQKLQHTVGVSYNQTFANSPNPLKRPVQNSTIFLYNCLLQSVSQGITDHCSRRLKIQDSRYCKRCCSSSTPLHGAPGSRHLGLVFGITLSS